ncbi:Uncharacterized protein dnl_46760 [Desulfonema limicola]|uniref:Lipoprotein n=1 Tax=Desulfonema limicola TaxID=45656 RepID=A0A975GI98_9BACT|nr:hypothetical protein [Desulfonema limicola]QTA82302.1 Uncharacterized protein dnl_46760 [Desulfonema limicola]
MLTKSVNPINCILMILVFSLCSCAITHQPAESLFTQDEAASLDLNQLQGKSWDDYVNQNLMGSRSASTGPRIEIKYPLIKSTNSGPTIETTSPSDMSVIFTKRKDGNPVDMSSLEVVGKKGWLKQSLTDKFRPYIKGEEIKATNMPIPKGKFHLQVSIADTGGLKTVENYLLIVK